MSKIGLIIGREYFTRVKKKSFLVTTILVPLLMMGFYAAIIAVAVKGGSSGDKKKLAIIDEAGFFTDSSFVKAKKQTYVLVKNETEKSFINKYKDLGYAGFLYIPRPDSAKAAPLVLHSQSSLSLGQSEALEDMVNDAYKEKKLLSLGISTEEYKIINKEVDIQSVIDTKEGGKKTHAAIAGVISFICGILIYMMMIIYGSQVMRGVTEEKTSRIAEVVVSSVKPFDLMMGKIVGIGAVGLTQFAIWIVLFGSLQLLLPLFMPGMTDQVNSVGADAGKLGVINEISSGLSTLPIAKILGWFMFYFLMGYLTYASLFAAVGSVVSEDQQEAQQFVFPIIMPIILGFFIMIQAVEEPDTNMALFGSLFPLTSPVVMMGRITYDIPAWQLIVSAVLLVGTFILFTWLTAKIYRTGILMYGKKPSWKEMIKWAFKKQ
ncbi:MAG: ABC transporter permease [Ferruginibacter sp.]